MTDQEKVTAGGADTVERPAPEVPAPVAEAASQAGVADPEAPEAPAANAEVAAAPPEAGKEPKAPARRGRPRLRLEDLVVGTETHGKVVGISKFGGLRRHRRRHGRPGAHLRAVGSPGSERRRMW